MIHILFVLMFLASGCTQIQMLPYLDQVMVLKDLGEDKKAQEEMVKKIDADFDRMREAIAHGQMGKFKTEKALIKAFGPPIISEHEVVMGKIYRQSLYRYAIQSKSPDKVNIYLHIFTF